MYRVEQRQQGVQLAGELASQADATRARQLAAIDLGTQVPAGNPVATPVTAPPMRGPIVATTTPATRAPPRAVVTPPKPTPAPAPRPAADSGGTWRIQLGAFGVAGNADILWAKVRSRPEVAGHPRLNVKAGAVTKLQAGGYSPAGAQAACSKLKAAGYTCVAVPS